jgi:subtilisin family serine protease
MSYEYSMDGSGVDIYILDTGVVSHPDYEERYKGCVDYTGEGCYVSSESRHGSHVAGTAVGTSYGVAKNANLYNYKVLKSTGLGSYGWVASAVDDIKALKEANPYSKIVINMSLGGGYYEPMNQAVDSASAAGVVVVVAAGNDATDACLQSPALLFLLLQLVPPLQVIRLLAILTQGHA